MEEIEIKTQLEDLVQSKLEWIQECEGPQFYTTTGIRLLGKLTKGGFLIDQHSFFAK